MICHGEEPRGSLECVGAAGLQVEGAQAPVLQLTHKVLGTDALSEVQLPLAVQAQDILKYSRWSVKVELPGGEGVGVTQSQDLGYK